MDRKLFGFLSGWQFTILAMTAMIVPGALFAAVATQAVSITDPNTGAKSYIDGGRKLSVYDPVAGYRNYPGDFVDFRVSNNGNICESSQSYTVPSGKALVITNVTGFLQQFNGVASAGIALYVYGNCGGTAFNRTYAPVSTAAPSVPLAIDFGAGVAVPAGSVITVDSLSDYGYTYIHGYLVPASAVPSTGTLPPASAMNERKK